MLKNLSIRRKLALMLVGPLVALVVVAVLSILGDLDRASTASDAMIVKMIVRLTKDLLTDSQAHHARAPNAGSETTGTAMNGSWRLAYWGKK